MTPVVGRTAHVLLYWLPLGTGGRSGRWDCRVFEHLVARHEHRPTHDLYHSVLEVRTGGERFVVEMARSGPTTGWTGASCWKAGLAAAHVPVTPVA